MTGKVNRLKVWQRRSVHIDHNLQGIKKIVDFILFGAVILEVLFFPELKNVFGCLMTIICWWIFRSFFLHRRIIVLRPFSFLMFLSMLMYRVIPLMATLVEGKPITFGFENAHETFFYEILLFLVSALAFYLSSVHTIQIKNNRIQQALYRLEFFKIDSSILWAMGLIGLGTMFYGWVVGEVEYGDVSSKFLVSIKYLVYAPAIMLFPSFKQSFNHKSRINIFIYLGVVFILSLASNSRQAMLMPIGTIVLLFCLYIVKRNIPLRRFISPLNLGLAVVLFIFGMGLISDISLAMLANRSIRADVSREELFMETWRTLQDNERMEQLRQVANTVETSGNESYISGGWTETYIDNFMLNRYGNMRVSDQTIFYANRIGWSNSKMQEDFWTKMWATLPTPILNALGIQIDKTELEYSRGDYLYDLGTGAGGLGGYRVTSHIGDGLATWGGWYFIIQFVLFFLVFKLLNCFVVFTRKGIMYAPYGLMAIFLFLGMFRNANGHIQDLTYIIRGFWQACFTYLVVYWMLRWLLKNVIRI